MKCSWSTMIFKFLLLPVVSMNAWAYKILVIPMTGKSHVFAMAAMSESLVNKGHQVVLFVGENFPLNLPELRNRSEFSVTRYRDTTNGTRVNYDTMTENITRSVIESGGNDLMLMATNFGKMFVNLSFLSRRQIIFVGFIRLCFVAFNFSHIRDAIDQSSN